jgi:hypothetical protein
MLFFMEGCDKKKLYFHFCLNFLDAKWFFSIILVYNIVALNVEQNFLKA